MASLSDIDLLVKVRFDYFTAEDWKLSPERRRAFEATLRQYYTNHLNIDFFAFFVEVAGDIASVAFLAVSEKPANPSFPTGKTGTVLNVLTYPAYRRKGYATKALDAIVSEAKKRNLSCLELSASDAGKPLYEKLAFKAKEPSAHFTEMKRSLL